MLHALLVWTVFALASCPALYYLFALDTVRRFFPVGGPAVSPGKWLPVSVLKPVRGLDRHAHDHFTSFCQQNYPEFEILFAVADAEDPAIPIIEQVIAEFPERTIRLVTGGPRMGANRKVDKLCWLAREARHDLLVVSDSDVTVPRDYLHAVAEPFRDRQVGLVTCLYRGASDGSVTSDLEAIGISTDFVPGVIVARRLEGIRFALGATMAIRRSVLAEIGGFEALAEYCADDYELGRRVAATGRRIEISRCVVSTSCAAENASAFFKHQLRWAVTIRHARPYGYLGKLLATQGLPASVAVALVARSTVAAGVCLSAYVVLRLTLAWTTAVRLNDDIVRRRWWLVPLWDALAFGVALAGLVTNRVDWRGQDYELRRGKLIVLHRP